MKALVFLLVLVNVLFYAYSEGYLGAEDNPDAMLLTTQINPDSVRLVGRGESPENDPVPSPGEAPAPSGLCLVWQPLGAADADRVMAAMKERFPAFSVQRGESDPAGASWWVHIPPLPDKASAEKKAAEVRGLGVSDYFIPQEGAARFAISLGVFSSEQGATARLAELRAKGIRSARIAPHPESGVGARLEIRGPQDGEPALREALLGLLPAHQPVSCP